MLKPFWLSISKEDQPSLIESLSSALLNFSQPSVELREAIRRALNIPQSPIIPFYGYFLAELELILQNVSSSFANGARKDSLCENNDTIQYALAQNDDEMELIVEYREEDHYMWAEYYISFTLA